MFNTLTNKELLRKSESYVVPAIVVLVGLSAFGLGRLSVITAEEPRLIINQPPRSLTAAALQQSSGQAAASALAGEGNFVASKSGTKYYLPECSGAARIKEENKVWFTSAQEAQTAGYEPAANCPGL